MSNFSNPEHLRKIQYRNDSNLNARVELHKRFSINKGNWPQWVFKKLQLRQKAEVLELGCGPGYLWAENEDQHSADWQITLSDISSGMVSAAHQKLQEKTGFRYLVCDAQNLPLPTGSFNAVIANHMLYHVPDVPRTIRETWRVLKPGGRLYATTNGKNHLKEIWDWTAEALPSRPDSQQFYDEMLRFSLENGRQILGKKFASVERVLREDGLAIDEAQPLIDFIASSSFYKTFDEHEAKVLSDYLGRKIMADKVLRVTKNTGLFVAVK